ncbi:hypothetical protein [Schleiferilactobacillus perolens]|jgi:hypothetical protein|uniref:DUF5673 domain-containing protein n=1 Tax=Schleiferilactobacillus perolens DSM 12744 TaxID=1423792 RepID=A0A0R1NA84_9LACO|nr:hypothetical protein [Schleiferilactobacillus perolens]KRL13851.1 hypothetical protein FD09_GL001883 [Schleiferilactobacillus perolens DSM 12744]MCI1891864.1 hypothetical protein [Schleiferilactobacillus harbinensis]MCI1911631.1 hypothetical protein [Schleiferilactobacillus harbinensis]MCI2171835.1 hypothetical protein [Schleiferilactobacillus perolens]
MIWTTLMFAIDAMLLIGCLVAIYWQGQIVIRSRYNLWPLLMGLLIMSFGSVGTLGLDQIDKWLFIVGLSAFILNCIQAGVGGIGDKRLVNSGFFSATVQYDRLAGITLIPLTLPNGKERVVAIFVTNAQQRIQLSFSQALPTIQKELRSLVPGNTPIEVQNIEQ